MLALALFGCAAYSPAPAHHRPLHAAAWPQHVPPPERRTARAAARLQQEFPPADRLPPEQPAFLRPTTAEGLRSYLLGAWTLRKATTYKAGGLSGRLEGEATFANMPHPTRELVRYSECGTFAAARGKAGGAQLEARNAQLYDFSAREAPRVDVFYDAPSAAPRGAEEAAAAARFLYSIEPASLELTEQDDGAGNVYTGTLEIAAADAFLVSWEVAGPSKEGSIISMFTRRRPAFARGVERERVVDRP